MTYWINLGLIQRSRVNSHLSLFSWTGNRPPRITSPLIRAPLGARLSTSKGCFTIKFLWCKRENHKFKEYFSKYAGIKIYSKLLLHKWNKYYSLCCIFSWKNANQPDKSFAQMICSFHSSSVAKNGCSPKLKTSPELFIHYPRQISLASEFILMVHFTTLGQSPVNECSLWKLQTIKWIINNEKLLILRNPARPWKKSPATGKLFLHFK